jgi:hypothetical protein
MKLDKYKRRKARGEINVDADGNVSALSKKDKKKTEQSQAVLEVAGKKRKLEEGAERLEKKKKKSKS